MIPSEAVHVKRYANTDFAFVLPAEWQHRDESDATVQVSVFDCPDAPVRLIISLRRFALETPQVVVADAFSEIVRHRRASEVEVSEDPKDVLLTPEKIVDGGGCHFSKYAGLYISAHRRFAALITAENGKMLCFCVESAGTSDDHFNPLANSIFESVEVHWTIPLKATVTKQISIKQGPMLRCVATHAS